MGRIKRRVRQAGVYFVTAHTWQRRRLFAKPGPAEILLKQLLDCRERGFYRLHAFVIMPEHFHALLTPGEQTTLEKAMQMIKGGSGYEIRKQLGYKAPVWQPGYHDRWIRDADEYRTRKRYIELNPVSAKLWTGRRNMRSVPRTEGSGSIRASLTSCTSGAKAPILGGLVCRP